VSPRQWDLGAGLAEHVRIVDLSPRQTHRAQALAELSALYVALSPTPPQLPDLCPAERVNPIEVVDLDLEAEVG
jgi:hypothetical protein